MGESIVFFIFATIITILSVAVICAKNPITSVICLVFNLFFIAGIYAMQGADFAAAIQIIIYTGAILVLFLFVIMLLYSREKEDTQQPLAKRHLIFLAITLVGFFTLSLKILQTQAGQKFIYPKNTDNTFEVAIKMFTTYLWPFELSSLLILLAIVSCVLITKKMAT